jgi:hypothetical protein
MRIIEVALRYSTLQHEIHRLISSLFGRQECGNVRWSAAEKGRNQTTNLGVRSSNLFGRAKKSKNLLGRRCLGDAFKTSWGRAGDAK